MDEIEAVAKELASLGKTHNASIIARFADLLHAGTQNFDIEQIQKQIRKFPGLIIGLREKENDN